ncbi:pseudouridine synthase [Microcoleus sp. PH2017_18_LLB_O_A]|uniref:pseudouridine synthase n=1 Tax=Microcoleus sp. PH2017_18_LLB_O_A TaxID=2798829 RepID=UPI001DEABD67|nr:pseudouridine synthase [Microcoleus sp. PH2017_18_LLB_O_A]MCC3518924.1 rRNA pseudouridine synthase [Microcoleus sp. PH2017_18_LLB_O_A]
MSDERLQKILAQWGIASRRLAEQMIVAGRVRVNGNIVRLGQKANPDRDFIEVDGVPVKPTDRPAEVYLLLNKPAGVVSTCSDPRARSKVLDLLPPKLRSGQGIHPVGRLDADSTGALLLTNDGKLTFCLTHPRHSIAKTYQVWVLGDPPEPILQAWRQGIILSGRKTLPAKVRVIDRARDQTLLEVRTAEQLGYPVVRLHRTAIGPIQLQPPAGPILAPGCYRPLEDSEIIFLWNLVNLTSISVPVNPQEHSI